jgi:hypothetical protein
MAPKAQLHSLITKENKMNTLLKKSSSLLLASIALTVLATAGCASKMGMDHGMGMKQGGSVSLSGSSEVPPVSTAAKGSGTIMVASDKSVSGSVTTSGVDGKAAHIHEGAAGANGPVIVPLAKTADNTWSVPSGAKLTDAQYASYMAGNLYVNVHSAAYAGGEIRGQLAGK